MNIAAYCRVSTDKNDQLNSLEAQKQFFEEYTKKNNHMLVKIYADEGISGTKIKNRKQFLRLLQDANSGLFDTVVVKDISRFARNTVDFLNSIRQLKALGIETVFLTSNQTVLGNSEFILTIFGALAQEESANTSKRVKFGKKLNAQKGRVPNIIYGYDKIAGDYFNLSINHFEAKIVQRVFNLYTNDGFGANKIAQILNSEGIRTKRKCRWSQNAITRILTNKIYIGKVINGKQEVEDFLTGVRKSKNESEWFIADKPSLRIIDDEVFLKAARLLKERNQSFNINHQRQSNRHLLSTLIKCDCCGYSFRRTQRFYKNEYIKWVCSGRNTYGAQSCNNLSKIDERKLLQSIKDYFTNILNSKFDVVRCIEKEFNNISQNEEDNYQYITHRIAKAQKSREKLFEIFSDDLITRDELNDKVNELNNEIEKLKNTMKFRENILHIKDSLDVDSMISTEFMTNAQLKRLIEKIVVDKHGKIDVYLRNLTNHSIDNQMVTKSKLFIQTIDKSSENIYNL